MALSTTETLEFTLPGGLLEPSGECVRHGHLRPLTGGDEDWLCSLSPTTRHAALITALLARCVMAIGTRRMTSEMVRDLSIADRDYLLLKLREATFGPKLSRVFRCPKAGCGAKMDLDLLVDDFPVDERPLRPSYQLRLEGQADGALDVEFRVPRGHEQELIAAASSGSFEALRDRLLAACILRTGAPDGVERSVDELTESGKEALAAAIEQAAPHVELDLELVCPECSVAFDVALDPAVILLEEIVAGRTALERELHLLAYHYHWPLSELLELTRPRRQRFLRILVDELGTQRGRAS